MPDIFEAVSFLIKWGVSTWLVFVVGNTFGADLVRSLTAYTGVDRRLAPR